MVAASCVEDKNSVLYALLLSVCDSSLDNVNAMVLNSVTVAGAKLSTAEESVVGKAVFCSTERVALGSNDGVLASVF